MKGVASGPASASNFSGVLSPANGGTGVANAASQTITRSGAHALTITTTGTTNVTLPTSGTLATTAQIPTAPVFDRVVRTAGDITTTSTTLVDVTGATVTFTTGARPVSVGATCSISSDGLASSVWVNIDVDGTLQLGTAGLRAYEPVINNSFNMSFSHQTAALTAAAHTLKMQWKVDANTGTIAAGSATNFGYWAHEIS